MVVRKKCYQDFFKALHILPSSVRNSLIGRYIDVICVLRHANGDRRQLGDCGGASSGCCSCALNG